MTRPASIPQPSRHASGRGVVRLSGKDFYLGPRDCWPKSRKTPPASVLAEYEQVIREWLDNGRTLPADEDAGPSINALILRYDPFIRDYYHRPGKEDTHYRMVRDALRIVSRLYGDAPAEEFSPKKLIAVRAEMIRQDWSRTYTTQQTNRVKAMFRWGVEQELVSGSVYHALQAVRHLREGQAGVRETKPVTCVPDAVVDACIPFMPPAVAAMIRLQSLTGMRPSEVCSIRPADIDRSREVWLYRPPQHKTRHKGKTRTIAIGPQGQAVLRQWLKDDAEPESYVFSPAVAEETRNAERRRRRRTPMTPSQSRRKRTVKPKRPKRERYDETSYRTAVNRAADKAFPPPDHLRRRPGESAGEHRRRLSPAHLAELKAWVSSHRWSPNRIRHNAATKIANEFGLDAARAQLGHSSIKTTTIYAEMDDSKASEVMKVMG